MSRNRNSVKLMRVNQDYITKMESCVFRYDWTIKNFSQLTGETIKSPNFSSDYSNFDDKWSLEMYTYDTHDNKDRYISFDLQLHSFNDTSLLQTECKISINNKKKITRERDFNKFPGKMTWDRYSTRLRLLNPVNGYVEYDELRICCIIEMFKKQTNNLDEISTFNPTPTLSVDLKELLLNKKSADVTIQVGQKSFRAIKGILAVRSPVFSTMFEQEELKEIKNNELVIDDIEEDVFEEFLHFIYTDESPNVKKMPMELLAVAEKYQVDCLKNICEEVICLTINLDSVASLLICSDKYNLEKLNEKCLEFLRTNLQDVTSNKTFQVYQKKYPEIFVGVLQELLLSTNSVNYS